MSATDRAVSPVVSLLAGALVWAVIAVGLGWLA